MEKLTIQHIAPYLPYGLKMYNSNIARECDRKGQQYNPTTLKRIGTDGLFWVGKESDSRKIGQDIHLPMLYPISCLTKTIQHEGREFIPIVELAKIAYPSSSRNFVLKGKYAIDTTSDLAFGFDYKDFESFDTNSAIIKPTFNQYALFQKLAEWHINFVGIPEGLYIDKNTLK